MEMHVTLLLKLTTILVTRAKHNELTYFEIYYTIQ